MNMSIAEYKEITEGKKPSKYRNTRTKVDGISFDSQAEARRYVELKTLKAVGDVNGFILQPRFILQEGFENDGVVTEKMEYVADFLIMWADGRTTIEDVKGVRTDVYKLKVKLFEKKYPKLKIIEVR